MTGEDWRVPIYATGILIFRLTRSTLVCKHLAISATQPGRWPISWISGAGEDGYWTC